MTSLEYDIYCEINPSKFEAIVKDTQDWKLFDSGIQLLVDGNLISLWGPYNVETEDMPPEVWAYDRQFQYMLTLVIETPQDVEFDNAFSFALSLMDQACVTFQGVCYSRNSDTADSPLFEQKKDPMEISERKCDLLEISFFYEKPLDENSITRLWNKFLDLPEMIFSRYGNFEPLQYKVSEEGLDKLQKFLLSESSPLLSLKYPFLSFNFSQPDKVGGSSRGYRCNYISISIDNAYVENNFNFFLKLKKIFQEVALSLECFYADVHILKGYSIYGSQLLILRDSQDHPVQSWWWKGIPEKLGVALLIGPPYSKLWPTLEKKGAKIRENYYLLEDNNWKKNLMIKVPSKIREYRGFWSFFKKKNIMDSEKSKYPAIWPFSDPYDEI